MNYVKKISKTEGKTSRELFHKWWLYYRKIYLIFGYTYDGRSWKNFIIKIMLQNEELLRGITNCSVSSIGNALLFWLGKFPSACITDYSISLPPTFSSASKFFFTKFTIIMRALIWQNQVQTQFFITSIGSLKSRIAFSQQNQKKKNNNNNF
jgi:hypothetical protein